MQRLFLLVLALTLFLPISAYSAPPGVLETRLAYLNDLEEVGWVQFDGNNVYIGANAVVLNPVPDDCTVVGVPGRCVKQEGKRVMSTTLRHDLIPDPILERLEELQKEILNAEEEIRRTHPEKTTFESEEE